jgi:L-asparagine permease
MSMNGSAPKFTSRMSKGGVPYGGILLTAFIGLFGVLLNGVVPGQAFEIVLNMAALGIIASWGTIVICQIQLYRWSKKGILNRPSFQLWGSPYTGYVTLAFLAAVLVLMGFDHPIGTWTVATLVLIIPALIIGWYAVRGRVLAVAQERQGYTGPFPVVANRPLPDDKNNA